MGEKARRQEVIKAISEHKIIAIVRGVEKEQLIPLAEALYAGGVRLMEITYNACGKPSDEETAENIALLASHMNGRMYVGAGTVLTVGQVELTQKAGGAFIISPNVSEAVIAHTRFEGLVSIPGALTPTEIVAAHEAIDKVEKDIYNHTGCEITIHLDPVQQNNPQLIHIKDAIDKFLKDTFIGFCVKLYPMIAFLE